MAAIIVAVGFFHGCGGMEKSAANSNASIIPGQLIVQLKSGADIDASNQESMLEDTLAVEMDGKSRLESIRRLVPDASVDKIATRWRKDTARLNDMSVGAKSIDRQLLKKADKMRGLVVIKIDGIDGQETIELSKRLRESGIVEYALPDLKIKVDIGKEQSTAAAETCDDPSYTQTWSMDKIDRAQAWTVTSGSPRAVVAVLDTGVDYHHNDLKNNIWTNAKEIPNNGVDDDHNGYVDDVHGYNFSYNNADPMDTLSHGTHVAGIIAANGTVKGVAPRARIMPLRIIDDLHDLTESQMVESVNYAIANGADIVNCSFSYSISLDSTVEMQEYNQLLSALDTSDLLMVFGAGNDSFDCNTTTQGSFTYFAKYNKNKHHIVTASTVSDDSLASYSNWGSEVVYLAAPGQCVYSTIPDNGYGLKSGTSMAAPHVAGVAALIKSKYPHFNNAQIKQCIFKGTDAIPALQGKVVTGGRLNAGKCLAQAALMPERSINFNLPANGNATSAVAWWGAPVPVMSINFTITSNYPIASVKNATLVSGNTYRITYDPNQQGAHSMIITATDNMNYTRSFVFSYNSGVSAIFPIYWWYIYTLGVSYNFSVINETVSDVYQLIFNANLESGYDVFTTYTDEPSVFKLADCDSIDSHAALSPDGSKIAYLKNDAASGAAELYVMNSDGSGIRQLTQNDSDDYNPVWSPDSTKIAYESYEGDTGRNIFVINSDGTGKTQVTNVYEATTPDWSPSGSMLVMNLMDEIASMTAIGSNVTQLTSNYVHDYEPQWSPDGTKIMFLTIRDGDWDIYVMNADGSNQTNLTNDSLRNIMPKWSPNGSKIAYITVTDENSSNGWKLFVMNANGSGKIQITNTQIWPSRDPVWSPDSKKIFFLHGSFSGSLYNIMMVNPDGSGLTQVTKKSADYGNVNVRIE